MLRAEEVSEKFQNTALRLMLSGMIAGIALYGLAQVLLELRHAGFTVEKILVARDSWILLPFFIASPIALVWSVWELNRLSKLSDEVRNWQFGMRGEQVVAEKLMSRELAEAGYTMFHDVPGPDKTWNVDHVAVGPAGVFVIETKARSRRKAIHDQAEHEVCYDGRSLEFPWCTDNKVVDQVQSNAKWIRKLLENYAPKNILVYPVIVVPGWYVKPKGNYLVKAMNASYLVQFLKSAKPQFRVDDLRGVIKRLDEQCRDVEF